MSHLESEQDYMNFDKEHARIRAESDVSYSEYRNKMQQVNKSVIGKLSKISVFCTVFMVIELIGGYIAHSLAIMTDAAHLLSDLSGFLISIVSLYIATRPANHELTYGYHRAEVVGALASIMIIWVLTVWLVTEAIQRLITPSEIDAFLMLCISICGLLFNLIMGKILTSEDLPNAFEKAEKTISEGLDKVNENYKDSKEIEINVVKTEEDKNREKEKESAVLRATIVHILGIIY